MEKDNRSIEVIQGFGKQQQGPHESTSHLAYAPIPADFTTGLAVALEHHQQSKTETFTFYHKKAQKKTTSTDSLPQVQLGLTHQSFLFCAMERKGEQMNGGGGEGGGGGASAIKD